ncbi:MAG: PAS domain-containing protein [Planctomycetes bacterium]|nr:PAS domain-containing protein [Planctomycetota bacterium]
MTDNGKHKIRPTTSVGQMRHLLLIFAFCTALGFSAFGLITVRRAETWKAWATFTAGVITTVLLAAHLIALTHASARDERHAAELERANRRLGQSQAFLQTVIDALPEPMMVINPDRTIALANRAARLAAEKTPTEGRTMCFEVFHRRNTPCDGTDYVCPFEQVVTTKAPQTTTHIHRHTEMNERIVEITAAPILDDTGEVVQVIESCLDVTDRDKARREVADIAKFPAEDPNPVLRVAPDGRVLYANAAARNVLLAEHEPHLLSSLPQWPEILVQALDSAAQKVVELQFGERTLNLTFVPVAEGGYVNVYGRDVTERKRAEEKFLQAQKMEAIGILAGGVAHDFRNQLTVIRGFSEMLARRSMVTEEGRDKITEILKAVERSTNLTGQLLAFSRKEILEPQVLNLADLVGELSASLERIVGEDIRFCVSRPFDMCLANVDRNLFDQAVMNLVVNARDAMPQGGELVIETDVVAVDAEQAKHLSVRPGDYSVVYISDTGCGMDEKTQLRAFEPFFTTKQTGEGTGLGLSMVQGFVEQSGGFIECVSEIGKGTQLSIYFPSVQAELAEEGLSDQAEQVPRGSETILLVEDEESLRRVLVESLKEGGYQVLEAVDCTEAISLLKRFNGPIDMLITDVVMPDMNGVQLAERIEATRPGIAVLFVSGYAQGELSRRGAGHAEENLLAKPFTHEKLLRRIREVLGASRPAAHPVRLHSGRS